MSSTTAGKTAVANNDVDAYENVADDSPPRTTNGDFTSKAPRMGSAPEYNPPTRPKGSITVQPLRQQ